MKSLTLYAFILVICGGIVFGVLYLTGALTPDTEAVRISKEDYARTERLESLVKRINLINAELTDYRDSERAKCESGKVGPKPWNRKPGTKYSLQPSQSNTLTCAEVQAPPSPSPATPPAK